MRHADALKDIGKLEANQEGPYKVVVIQQGGAYELEDGKGKCLAHPYAYWHIKKYYP